MHLFLFYRNENIFLLLILSFLLPMSHEEKVSCRNIFCLKIVVMNTIYFPLMRRKPNMFTCLVNSIVLSKKWVCVYDTLRCIIVNICLFIEPRHMAK